ncbi:hypothetical protein AB0J35_27875 [Nonomuraea angiospora]|uniref:hypothetical protein n=1 Tax=Nonomuraea angiospora TaxID=46172 RepID=UPI0034274705
METAARLLDYVGGALVLPQTVLVEADAFPWLSREGQVVDTTEQPPAEVARTIANRLG